MVASHVCHSGLSKELCNVPSIAHIVHDSLVAEHLHHVKRQLAQVYTNAISAGMRLDTA